MRARRSADRGNRGLGLRRLRNPCAGPIGPRAAVAQRAIGKHIQHLVIIVQENRSFDNLFAGWPGADTSMSGQTSTGMTVPLRRITFDGGDIGHGWTDAVSAWDNVQNGWLR
jgi:phospholipase C